MKHTVFSKLKPGVRANTPHALPCKTVQVERRCPRLWRPRLWQDVGTSNRFQSVRDQFLFSCHTQLCIAESTKTHAPAPFSLARSTARLSVVRCRVVSFPACGAVLCRAVPCFAECSLSCISDDNASKHTELAIASMYVHMSSGNFIRLLIITSFSVAVFIFHLFLDWHKHPRAVRMQQQTAAPQYVYSPEYELYAVEPRAQQSTAQSPLHKAANQVHDDQSTYHKKHVRTCMLRPVCYPEHGALGICKSSVCT